MLLFFSMKFFQKLKKIPNKVNSILNRPKMYAPFAKEDFKRWLEVEGDSNHRLNYKLDADSIIFDVGGYLGEWSEKICEKYNPTIYIFEPVEKYFTELQKKFSGNSKITVIKKALGSENRQRHISIKDDSSTVFGSKNLEEIEFIDIKEFLEKENILKVDLIKINIEGGEYELMDRIISSEIQNKFESFQIQFHRFVPNCIELRDSIRSALSNTHKQTYNFDFIWENWSK